MNYIYLFLNVTLENIRQKPLSSVQQWHAGQDQDEHSGPSGHPQRAVAVVTLAVAKIPNSLSAL